MILETFTPVILFVLRTTQLAYSDAMAIHNRITLHQNRNGEYSRIPYKSVPIFPAYQSTASYPATDLTVWTSQPIWFHLYHPKIGCNTTQDNSTVKPVLSGHSNRRPKIGFQDQLLLNSGQKHCRMLQESILQYFPPSLSYHLSLRSLFCLFLSGRLRQVSL